MVLATKFNGPMRAVAYVPAALTRPELGRRGAGDRALSI
ncbi:hypothetical protein SAMN04489716_1552 [Actinoplanes derwentensis]|uniref:Uncharacterized protein n=1 Tax=Actinoplanes derwentensis TaxID=113562 RepID=A0A1H1UUP9_9ACTN|nr:hypothetical protein SAMN04489716_1552 [Actinoplanes derwentensis]